MDTSLSEIKKELQFKTKAELLDYCIRLLKFKKENKELMAFLLFALDEQAFIENVKKDTNSLFEEINFSNVHFIKKSTRKILRMINKNIRFSLSRQVEAELLIHFCNCFVIYSIPTNKSRQLLNIYETQNKKYNQALSTLHEDIQYDLNRQIIETNNGSGEQSNN
ncbi:MAG: hypothetical protein JSS98_00455 [Bacteroidetes bacterium]|nr:hypothetical protein [Bacteroidota bacterium]